MELHLSEAGIRPVYPPYYGLFLNILTRKSQQCPLPRRCEQQVHIGDDFPKTLDEPHHPYIPDHGLRWQHRRQHSRSPISTGL
jgi:hypothetical protein